MCNYQLVSIWVRSLATLASLHDELHIFVRNVQLASDVYTSCIFYKNSAIPTSLPNELHFS
jgi:hypothetical protein